MYETFFSLIRAGLWGTPPDTSLFSGMTPARWQQLYRLASTQSLLSVFFDGINTLPPNLYPPRNLYLQLAAQTLQIEQANDRLNRMVMPHPVFILFFSKGRVWLSTIAIPVIVSVEI